jgi:DNA-directed RNA polymerase subunit F
MPIFETIDGEKLDPSTNVDFRADIVINPGGVMNRLNPSQLIETELNYISKIIRYRAEKFRTVNQKVKLFKEFLSFVSEETLNDYTELFDSLDNKELKEAVSEIIKHGFYIRQDTFWDNLNMFSLGKIYKHFDIKPEKVKGVENPLTIGEEYYIRLNLAELKPF